MYNSVSIGSNKMYQAQKVWQIGLTEACSAAGTLCMAKGSGQLSLYSSDIQLLYKQKELCGSGSVSVSTLNTGCTSYGLKDTTTPISKYVPHNRPIVRSYQQMGTGAQRQFKYTVDSLQLARSVYMKSWRSYILANRGVSCSVDAKSVCTVNQLPKDSRSRKGWPASAQLAVDYFMTSLVLNGQELSASIDSSEQKSTASRWLVLASASSSMRANWLSGVVDAIGRFSCELKTPAKRLWAAALESTKTSLTQGSRFALVCDLGGRLWLHLNSSRLVSNSYTVIWSNTELDSIASSASSNGVGLWSLDYVAMTSNRKQSIADSLGLLNVLTVNISVYSKYVLPLIESSASIDQSQGVSKELYLSVCGRVSDNRVLQTSEKFMQLAQALRSLPRVEKVTGGIAHHHSATNQSSSVVSARSTYLQRSTTGEHRCLLKIRTDISNIDIDRGYLCTNTGGTYLYRDVRVPNVLNGFSSALDKGYGCMLGRLSTSRKVASILSSKKSGQFDPQSEAEPTALVNSVTPIIGGGTTGDSLSYNLEYCHGSVNRLKVLYNQQMSSIRTVIASLPLLDLDRSVSPIDLVYRDSAYKLDVKKQWLPASSVKQQRATKRSLAPREGAERMAKLAPMVLVNSRQPVGLRKVLDREWQLGAAQKTPLLGVIKIKSIEFG